MPSNTIGPSQKKSDTQIEEVIKASGGLDDIKKSLVNTIYTVVKEGITDTVDKKRKQKLMWWENPSLLLFKQRRRLTQSTKQRYYRHPIKQLIPQNATNLTQF